MGGSVLIATGLVPTLAIFGVVFLVFLVRPVMEVYFSSQSLCPHCEADLFLEVCTAESGEGVELGMRCTSCGEDATRITDSMGPVIDVE